MLIRSVDTGTSLIHAFHPLSSQGFLSGGDSGVPARPNSVKIYPAKFPAKLYPDITSEQRMLRGVIGAGVGS